MKHITFLFLFTILLSACVPAKQDQPSGTPQFDTTSIQVTATPGPPVDLSPKPTPDIAIYQVIVGDAACALEHLELEEELYITNCADPLYLPLYSEIPITLAPTGKDEFQLKENEENEELIEILFHDSLIGYFVKLDVPNQANCVIPHKDTAGDSVICAFTLAHYPEITIIISGTTIR